MVVAVEAFMTKFISDHLGVQWARRWQFEELSVQVDVAQKNPRKLGVTIIRCPVEMVAMDGWKSWQEVLSPFHHKFREGQV